MLKLLNLMVRLEWPIRLLNPLFGRFNPFLSEFRSDPYPRLAELRSREPVYFSPVLRGWVLTRYADVARVLRDPRFSVDRTQISLGRVLNPFRAISPEFGELIKSTLLMLDPPAHTRIRTLVNKAFTPRMVEVLRPRIQEIINGLLDHVEERGEMDLIRDLAFPLPLIVIAEMLGVPAEDRASFRRWSNDLTALLDPLSSPGGLSGAQAAFEEIAPYFKRILAERRREPRADLISALAAVEGGEGRLDETELLALCLLILGAGHETTVNLIGNSVAALLRNPGERKRLQEEPSLLPTAVEEFLRYDSPVQITDRLATEDVEIGGRQIRKGQLVGLLLGAANRDPEQFPLPDRLDVERRENRHLAFGHGVHFCLGAPLARTEAQLAIGTLLRRFPHLDGPEPEHWRPSIVLRGPVSLPLSLGDSG